MKYLLDTNVISESASKAPDENVLSLPEKNSEECVLSSLSPGEIWKGIHLLPAGKRKSALVHWADGIASDFTTVTLALDTDVPRVWAKLCAKHEARGNNLCVMDSLLAATAIFHGLTLVTRNTKHFPPEVAVLNPWLSLSLKDLSGVLPASKNAVSVGDMNRAISDRVADLEADSSH